MVKFLDMLGRNPRMRRETTAPGRRTHILLTPLDVFLMFAYSKMKFWTSRRKHKGLR